MASIKRNELKAMDEKTARQKMAELKTELMKLRAQVAVGTNIESPGRIKATRRNIARMMTFINSKKKLEAGENANIFKTSKKIMEVNKKA